MTSVSCSEGSGERSGRVSGRTDQRGRRQIARGCLEEGFRESAPGEGRRQDRLGRVLESMLGSAQTVNTNPGSQEIEKSMNQRPANRFGGCTHPPVERHSVVVPSPGPTFEIRRTLRRMAAGFAKSPGLDCVVTIGTGGRPGNTQGFRGFNLKSVKRQSPVAHASLEHVENRPPENAASVVTFTASYQDIPALSIWWPSPFRGCHLFGRASIMRVRLLT